MACGRVALLALVLVVLAAGCGSQKPAAGSFTPVEPGTLTVATAEIPTTGFWDGTPVQVTGGFEWDLANALADRFGLDRVRVVTVPFAQLVAGDLGGADLALSELTATAGREKVLRFSTSYLPASPAVLVKKGVAVPDLKTARKLTWAVRGSTTLQTFLHDVVLPDSPPLVVATRDEAVRALQAGKVEAVLFDLPVAAALAQNSGGQLDVAGQFDTPDDFFAAMPKHSANREAVDSALRALEADGTMKDLVSDSLGPKVIGSSAPAVIRTRQ